MKKILKTLAVFAITLTFVIPMVAVPAYAGIDLGLTGDNSPSSIGLGNKGPKEIAVNIIKLALTFLGLLAVIMILIGGFKWMTAGGNEDAVGDAKKIIIAGVIGLVIIIASWGITNFVISSLLTATGTQAT